jgi:elongation factor G
MAGVTTHTRNVVLVGHQGNGKTSVAEALLYRAGVIPRPGRVDDGGAVTDHEPEERARHQSVSASVATFDWKGTTINLIDTPGYADFAAEALAGLRVAELAVFVIDAVSGVQTVDQILWRQAGEWRIPRVVFINKLDRDRTSFDRALDDVRAHFGAGVEPMELPIGAESGFHGVAELLTERAYLYDTGRAVEGDVPEELAELSHAAHDHLVEDVVEGDDDLLEQYLGGTEPSPEALEHALHDALDQARVFPVLCGSATAPIGIDRLAEFICRMGPAPGDVPPLTVRAGTATVEVPPDPDGEPVLYVFKTRIDEYLGALSVFKVLSGTVPVDTVLVNPRSGASERLHQLLVLCGGRHQTVREVSAGDIAATAKLGDTRTGDTLAPRHLPVTVDPLPIQAPVYGVAVRARTKAHEDRLGQALQRLVLEDPSLSVIFDPETRQTVLRGGGDIHLQVALSKLARFGVEVDTDDVRVAYRETLAGPVETEGRHKKQSGGHGQFGVASVRFEPLERGAGFEFVDKVTGGAIPKGLIGAVRAGIEDAMARGGRFGYPVVDVRATVLDGKHHPVDSSELAFKMAGSLALRAAIDVAGGEVLEPVSEVQVTVPSEIQGDVLGDLSSRRGQVLGTAVGPSAGQTEVMALVPTAEMLRYAVDLRSMTSGRATFTIAHHGYQPLPEPLRDRLTAEAV